MLVGVHCGLGSKAIVLFGNAEQKAKYLPMLARGETLAAYALTEPDIGSDAQNIKTTARLSDDGTQWILNGRKQWIGNGHRAGVIATFAQTPTERHGELVQRPTAFIIRPDMPGFRVAGTVRKLGIRGSTQAELHYENLEVPADHVLGTVGKGFAVAVHVLNGGRLSLAAGCTAGTKQLLSEMAAFTANRVQFSKPIAEFEITQRKLARTASDIYASDAMLGAARESGVADRRRLGARSGVLQGVRERHDLARRGRDGAARRRSRLREAVSVRATASRLAHQSHLRGHERDSATCSSRSTAFRVPAEQLKEIGSALRRPRQESRAHQRLRRFAPSQRARRHADARCRR